MREDKPMIERNPEVEPADAGSGHFVSTLMADGKMSVTRDKCPGILLTSQDKNCNPIKKCSSCDFTE